jgi:hypothetical protein
VGSTERYVIQEPLAHRIDQDSEKVVTLDHAPARSESIDRSTLAIEVRAPSSTGDSELAGSDASLIGQGYLNLSSPPRNYFLPPRINMVEKLPAEEANRDKIQANIVRYSYLYILLCSHSTLRWPGVVVINAKRQWTITVPSGDISLG